MSRPVRCRCRSSASQSPLLRAGNTRAVGLLVSKPLRNRRRHRQLKRVFLRQRFAKPARHHRQRFNSCNGIRWLNNLIGRFGTCRYVIINRQVPECRLIVVINCGHVWLNYCEDSSSSSHSPSGSTQGGTGLVVNHVLRSSRLAKSNCARFSASNSSNGYSAI